MPNGEEVPRNTAQARRGGGAGNGRNVTRQKRKRPQSKQGAPAKQRRVQTLAARSMGMSRTVAIAVPDTPLRMHIIGVPSARETVWAPPVGTMFSSGRITLGTADAARGGAVFIILISPRNCDPAESLRAREFYRGRLASNMHATYEAAQNVTLPGTITMRWILMPGVGYTFPAPTTADELVAHENLARSSAGAARARLTDSFSVSLPLGQEYKFDVENDRLEGTPGVPHTSESFRQDDEAILLEVTAANVPSSALTASVPLGTISVEYDYIFAGRHAPGVDG